VFARTGSDHEDAHAGERSDRPFQVNEALASLPQ
jgi:hypothetical protein